MEPIDMGQDSDARDYSSSPPEIATSGLDVQECVSAAVQSLTGRSFNAMKTGSRSVALRKALTPATVKLERQILRSPRDTTVRRLMRTLAEVGTLKDAVHLRIADEPITGKGRSKAALRSFLSLVDREVRLGALILECTGGKADGVKPLPPLPLEIVMTDGPAWPKDDTPTAPLEDYSLPISRVNIKAERVPALVMIQHEAQGPVKAEDKPPALSGWRVVVEDDA